jgi:ribosomal protein S18 acetylase RimI-like enzyme
VTNLVIRDARLADAPAVSELVCRVAAETIFADGPEDGRRYFMAMNTSAAIAGKMNDDAYRYYVAEQEGRVVGVAAMRGNSHMYHLFVDTALHGRGLGRALWEHARGECVKRGNTGRFTVNSAPGSIGFYERVGFRVSGGFQVRNGHPSVPMTLEAGGG